MYKIGDKVIIDNPNSTFNGIKGTIVAIKGVVIEGKCQTYEEYMVATEDRNRRISIIGTYLKLN